MPQCAPGDGERETKSWHVLHACETAEAALPIVDAESAVGMNPQLLSRASWTLGGKPNSLSLLNAWHDIRDWRHALNEAEAMTSAQLVHAHSFTSAMAAVRGSLPTVYDFAATMEEPAPHAVHVNNGPWLVRSLRVAEQFALSRAGAVVTHATGMKKLAHGRGAPPEHTFIVPEPIAGVGPATDRVWALDHALDLGYDIVLYALPNPKGAEKLLQAFAAIAVELERAVLVLEWNDSERDQFVKLARDLEIADRIRCITAVERSQGMACADVVIAPETGDAGARANTGMLQAMAIGKAVVAADAPENRECSNDGRGCVWFKPGDNVDLIQRATFIARNADFCRSLGENGRLHLAYTRAPEIIGRQYDEIYRYAQSRRTDNSPRAQMPKIYALGMQVLSF